MITDFKVCFDVNPLTLQKKDKPLIPIPKKPTWWYRLLKKKVKNIPFERVRFVDKQCLSTRTTHETERYWKTRHHQESRLIIEYNEFIYETWLKILIRRRQYLQYANDFKRWSQSASWPVVLKQLAFQNHKCLIAWYTSLKSLCLQKSASIGKIFC